MEWRAAPATAFEFKTLILKCPTLHHLYYILLTLGWHLCWSKWLVWGDDPDSHSRGFWGVLVTMLFSCLGCCTLLLHLGMITPSNAPVEHPGVKCILLHLCWEPAAVVHTNVNWADLCVNLARFFSSFVSWPCRPLCRRRFGAGARLVHNVGSELPIPAAHSRWSWMYRFHLTTDHHWACLPLWLGRSDETKLLRG